MQPEQESFEEMQRRLTGRAPSTWQTLSRRVKRINWIKVIAPAAVLSVPAAFAIRDVIGMDNMPPYVFATIYLLIFLVAATLFAVREGAKADKRSKLT